MGSGMLAWSFAARTMDEAAALLRALGRHRYVREVDHTIHWSVLLALSDLASFAAKAGAFRRTIADQPSLELWSRDPSLWLPADIEEVLEALCAFWAQGEAAERARARLSELLSHSDLALPSHPPFRSDPEAPPHPELVLLDWELLPICELDPERHQGAIAAMELAGEEVDVSAPVYVEGACLSVPELLEGAPRGVLPQDFVVWADGAYSYVDYVFRGVARSAKLVEPPVGVKDLE